MADDRRTIPAIFTGAVFSTALLLIEHIALWRYRNEISKPEAYVIGGATLGAGAVLSSALMDDWRPAATIWAGLIGGGLAIGGAYGVRGLLDVSGESRRRARYIQQRIERSLTGGNTDFSGFSRN